MTLPRLALFASVLLLAAPAVHAGNPAADHVIFSGANAAGTTAITFANNVYSFSFVGDETLTYQLDLSDPKAAGGMLRIHELTSDSWPMDGAGVIFRDAGGLFWFPTNLYSKMALTSHSVSGHTLTLNYLLSFNGSHPVRYEITQEQKALRIRFVDPTNTLVVANNFAGVTFGTTSGVETPKPIKMQGTLAQPLILFRHQTPSGTEHWFTSNMLDLLQSNACNYGIANLFKPVIGADWITSNLNTQALYTPLSNNTLAAPLDDAYLIIVTGRIKDALLTTTAPPSPYRPMLASRMFFDAPVSTWNLYTPLFDLYQSVGMYNLAGYFFNWSAGAADPPSQFNFGPDWSPGINENGFKSMLQKAVSYGAICAGYTAFNCMPNTAPPGTWDASQIARDSAGNPKTYFGLGYPMLAVEAGGIHAAKETAVLKQLGANGCFLDTQTYGAVSKDSDGDHLDQQAGSPWSKTLRQGFTAQKTWFNQMRTTLEGPLMGEGSLANANTNMEYLWFGYVDSVERCINTGDGNLAWSLPAGSPVAPTNWPIIPEYEWRVVARQQINHGNAFYDRFFGKSDGSSVVNMNTGLAILPLTQSALDLYQAFLITYGHAGFVITNGIQLDTEGYVTHAAAAQTYFMTNALQATYFATPVIAIKYWSGGKFKTFEEVLFQSESLDSFRHIPVALAFANGLKIYVNHGDTPMTVTEGGVTYTLPAKTGWYAGLPGWLTSFSAIPPGTGGNRIDYCNAIGQYEYFNGRGNVSGYGNISTSSKRSKWTVATAGLTVTEDSAGHLNPVQGAAPTLVKTLLLPQSSTLGVGDSIGIRAVAVFSNGSLRDVTTLVDWFAGSNGVASVNNAGVLKGLAPGQTTVVVSLSSGSAMAIPITISVHP